MINRRRVAFTLIELVVTLAIIGILAGLLIVGIGMALKAKKRMQTAILIDGLTVAVDQYLQMYGRLGDKMDELSTDFSERPLFFLVQRPALDGNPERFYSGDPHSIVDVQNTEVKPPQEAEAVRDFFGQLIAIEIKNERRQGNTSTSYDYPKEISIISPGYDIDDTGDDIGKRRTSQSTEWAALAESN